MDEGAHRVEYCQGTDTLCHVRHLHAELPSPRKEADLARLVRIQQDDGLLPGFILMSARGLDDVVRAVCPEAPDYVLTVAVLGDGDIEDVREVRIDVTPPVIALTTEPPMAQRGGVYFATADTRFIIRVSDALSGVESTEVAIDGTPYRPYTDAVTLPEGQHELRCRVTDRAGNRSETVVGDHVTGGATDCLRVTVR